MVEYNPVANSLHLHSVAKSGAVRFWAAHKVKSMMPLMNTGHAFQHYPRGGLRQAAANREPAAPKWGRDARWQVRIDLRLFNRWISHPNFQWSELYPPRKKRLKVESRKLVLDHHQAAAVTQHNPSTDLMPPPVKKRAFACPMLLIDETCSMSFTRTRFFEGWFNGSIETASRAQRSRVFRKLAISIWTC